MKNPYIILEISQDAEKKEIVKAKMQVMKKKLYPMRDIQVAEKQLLNPAKRLAADFMFPKKIKAKRLKKITTELEYQVINLVDIDKNAFNSL